MNKANRQGFLFTLLPLLYTLMLFTSGENFTEISQWRLGLALFLAISGIIFAVSIQSKPLKITSYIVNGILAILMITALFF